MRLLRRMKQKELAQLLGVTQSYISDLESGKKVIPTETLLRLTRMLEVGLEYFDPAGSPNQDCIDRLRDENRKLQDELATIKC